MTAHPHENPDAYEGSDMDAEMGARKRGARQMLERSQGTRKGNAQGSQKRITMKNKSKQEIYIYIYLQVQ